MTRTLLALKHGWSAKKHKAICATGGKADSILHCSTHKPCCSPRRHHLSGAVTHRAHRETRPPGGVVPRGARRRSAGVAGVGRRGLWRMSTPALPVVQIRGTRPDLHDEERDAPRALLVFRQARQITGREVWAASHQPAHFQEDWGLNSGKPGSESGRDPGRTSSQETQRYRHLCSCVHGGASGTHRADGEPAVRYPQFPSIFPQSWLILAVSG